jgi:hypothetical protein
MDKSYGDLCLYVIKKGYPYGIFRNLVMLINYKSIVKYKGIQLLQELKTSNYDITLFYVFIKTVKI